MTTLSKVWIGTSWKMNKTLAQATEFTQDLKAGLSDIAPRIQPFVVPPFTAVREVKTALESTRVLVGAQNMHWDDAGAWTGEVSAPMLVDCNLDLVELGHSERRAHFGETDETVGKKTSAALRHSLIPLVCIGETQEQMEAGHADAILAAQVEAALACVLPEQAGNVLFAYEPVWAIGAGGTPASPDYANERQRQIKVRAAELAGGDVLCLYGGSVTQENCADLIRQPMIDGLFIGRAAWQADGYLAILRRCAEEI